MKWFKVLEVNNVISEVMGFENCKFRVHTDSCRVQDIETGEIINVDNNSTNDLEVEIINKVSDFDLIEGDEFRIRT
jgi:hypothetical protein